jgi:hypothetical protein
VSDRCSAGDARLARIYASHDNIIALAKHYSIPTIYEWREAVAAGGLISYGTRGFAWTHRSCNVCHLDMLSWERG